MTAEEKGEEGHPAGPRAFRPPPCVARASSPCPVGPSAKAPCHDRWRDDSQTSRACAGGQSGEGTAGRSADSPLASRIARAMRSRTDWESPSFRAGFGGEPAIAADGRADHAQLLAEATAGPARQEVAPERRAVQSRQRLVQLLRRQRRGRLATERQDVQQAIHTTHGVLLDPSGLSVNQCFSRHSRSRSRARCNRTRRLASLRARTSPEPGRVQVLELSKDEDRGQRARQATQAAVEDVPELAVLHLLVRRLPRCEGVLPQPLLVEVPVEDGIGLPIRIGSSFGVARLRRTRRASVMIHDLMTEDGQKPGADGGLPLESVPRLERRQEGFLNKVLGQLPAGDPGACIPVQSIPVLVRPRRGVPGGWVGLRIVGLGRRTGVHDPSPFELASAEAASIDRSNVTPGLAAGKGRPAPARAFEPDHPPSPTTPPHDLEGLRQKRL